MLGKSAKFLGENCGFLKIKVIYIKICYSSSRKYHKYGAQLIFLFKFPPLYCKKKIKCENIMIVCHTTYLYEKQETIDEEYFINYMKS